MSVLPAAERRARVAALFDGVAATYDRVGVPWFTPIAQRLVEQLAPAPGERALDVGCGRGAALFPLAEAVGPAGRVTGIDLAPRMVQASGAEARARGLAQVEVRVMDAAAPRLPSAGYDLAVASFVLFFLPAPVAALRAWRELLVPGGRLGISTFAGTDAGWLDELFRPYLPRPIFGARAGVSTGPFGTDAAVEQLVTSAGYAAVRTSAFELEVAFSGVDQWYAWSRSHGQRVIWDRVAPADQDRVRAAAADQLGRLRAADGAIRLTQRIRFTLAERPLEDRWPNRRPSAAPTRSTGRYGE